MADDSFKADVIVVGAGTDTGPYEVRVRQVN